MSEALAANAESINAESINARLSANYLRRYASDTAQQFEKLPPARVVAIMQGQDIESLVPTWCKLVPLTAVRLLRELPEELARQILTAIPPNNATRILSSASDSEQEHYLATLDPLTRRELSRLLAYPEDTAGRLMDTRVRTYPRSLNAGETLAALRETGMKTARSLFVTDRDGQIVGRVLLQDLALADPETRLKDLLQPVSATVLPTAGKEEITEILEKQSLLDLPVVDIDGIFLGVIVHASLVQAAQESTSADIQTMVGVSREERALSMPGFAVRKRMPWLQVNLLTAFLAAAVVGLFENTIAQFTALAILLPVVAGQSGNAGAQALAVTMRGLALREISVRHWLRVMVKEIQVGLCNGLGIAVTCGLGVYLWSGSPGLVGVISVSMVLAMGIAGFAGAVVPITLVRLGQDPAQSSSIILTTITDVAGFFSFLGIATLMSSWL